MRWYLLALLVCGCGNSGDDFPVTPGGPGHGGGHNPDASIDGPDGGGDMLLGKVCLMTDPRQPTSACATTLAAGLTVTLGSNVATTVDDGSFSIARSTGTGLVWTVSGTNVVTSVIPLTARLVLPAMPAIPMYQELTGNNGVVPTAGNGDVFVQVVHGSTLVAGATAAASVTGPYPVFYDPASGDQWSQDVTGALGMAWIPGLLAGPVDVQVTPPAATTPIVLGAVPIVDSALTFVTAEVP